MPNPVRTESLIDVFTPGGAVAAEPRRLAARLERIAGARIALLDNGKEFSDRVLAGVADRLQHQCGAAEIRIWKKGFPAKGAPFISELAQSCDAVITGVGH